MVNSNTVLYDQDNDGNGGGDDDDDDDDDGDNSRGGDLPEMSEVTL